MITRISKALEGYINTNYGTNWEVTKIDEPNNSIYINHKDFGTLDFWLIDPNGRWDYTWIEKSNMKYEIEKAAKQAKKAKEKAAKEEEKAELWEQYQAAKEYYNDIKDDTSGDYDGQDREEALSDLETAYDLWVNFK